jgi:MFS family permease
MTDIAYPKFRWFVLIAYVIVTSSTSFSMIAPAPLVPYIAKALNVDAGVATAAAMMSFNLFMGVFAFIGGFFLDKVGIIRMWIICLVLVALGSLLTPTIGDTVSGLVICRFLHAAGTGPIMASVAALSAQRFKMSERSYVAAFQGFSVSLGVALGMYLSPHIFEAVGQSWSSTISWTVVFPALGMLFALVVLLGPKPAVVQSAVMETKEKWLSGEFKLALVGASTVWVLSLMGLIDSWCQRQYDNMMPGYYAADFPQGLGFGALGSTKLTLASLFMMAGTLVAPFLTEKVFKHNPKPTIFLGLTVAGLGILSFQTLTPTTGDLMLIGVPCVVLFFSSFVNPTIFGYVAKHFPPKIAGRLGGFVMLWFVFGATAGVGIGSYLLSSTGFYWKPMLLLAIVTFCGAIAVLFLRPPKMFQQADAAGN